MLYRCAILPVSEMVRAYVSHKGKIHSVLVGGGGVWLLGRESEFMRSLANRKSITKLQRTSFHQTTAGTAHFLFLVIN